VYLLCGYLVHIFSVLVCFAKKNLATLAKTRTAFFPLSQFFFLQKVGTEKKSKRVPTATYVGTKTKSSLLFKDPTLGQRFESRRKKSAIDQTRGAGKQ
jgi:hypothetical protein